jgi:hypothetical protein
MERGGKEDEPVGNLRQTGPLRVGEPVGTGAISIVVEERRERKPAHFLNFIDSSKPDCEGKRRGGSVNADSLFGRGIHFRPSPKTNPPWR